MVGSSAALINATPQILLQGGKEKRWQLTLPPLAPNDSQQRRAQ
jgi:hypothetical protein